jgi:hypothetical protein
MAAGDNHRPAHICNPERSRAGAANNANGDKATPANAGVVNTTKELINNAPDIGCPVATAKPIAQKTIPQGNAAMPMPNTTPRKNGGFGA